MPAFQQTIQPLLRRYLRPQVESLFQTAHDTAAEAAVHFLILLWEREESPRYKQALQALDSLKNKKTKRLFKRLLEIIPLEAEQWKKEFPGRFERAEQMKRSDSGDAQQALFTVLFPEGLGLQTPEQRTQAVRTLRTKRTVQIKQLNPDPIRSPEHELIFTSNILLTVPLSDQETTWQVPAAVKESLKQVKSEAQQFWYDHPIPLDLPLEKNEALYGLKGLQDALTYEQNVTGPLTVILSASATHSGLRALAKLYFDFLFSAGPALPDLQIFIFTEDDVQRLLRTVLKPLAQRYFPQADFSALEEVLGVDGEYGRHYSFLKAITAFWQVFVNPRIKGTFKIDLDQVFPQAELVRETGKTAFEHFKTGLWGAKAKDAEGNDLELGMLASALVNEKDIPKSLFTPDVRFPQEEIRQPEQLVFHSGLPQAQSTLAEMMTRYDGTELDGATNALQRIHVTGGTNGILLSALRTYRPFTPTFVGRAEDQSYILSVLFRDKPYLRYVHAAGLIMRHDKEAFAAEAIKAAAHGKIIGDYTRLLTFSEYANALPWPLKKIKEATDPFTGAFISPLPYTTVSLRFALKLLTLAEQKSPKEVNAFAELAARRLNDWLDRFPPNTDILKNRVTRERQAWNLYYDLLDKAETERAADSPFWRELQNKALQLKQQVEIKTKVP